MKRFLSGVRLVLVVVALVAVHGANALAPPCGDCVQGVWCPCNYTCYTPYAGGCMECTVCP